MGGTLPHRLTQRETKARDRLDRVNDDFCFCFAHSRGLRAVFAIQSLSCKVSIGLLCTHNRPLTMLFMKWFTRDGNLY